MGADSKVMICQDFVVYSSHQTLELHYIMVQALIPGLSPTKDWAMLAGKEKMQSELDNLWL